jgi:hypothetical protein
VTKSPHNLSRSKIDLFCQCPRCFWLDKKHGVAQPSGAQFVLNNLVDALLKKEYDTYRQKQEIPPFLESLGIKAIPFAHSQIDIWRDSRKGGIHYVHEATGLCLSGAVDDVWQLPSGELAIVEYKAKATGNEITLEPKKKKDGEIVKTDRYLLSYRRQIEFYQWLFRQNGFKVSNTAYFLFANAHKERDAFKDQLTFESVLITHVGDTSWVQPTLEVIALCLSNDTLPDAAIDCDYCKYRQKTGLIENIQN